MSNTTPHPHPSTGHDRAQSRATLDALRAHITACDPQHPYLLAHAIEGAGGGQVGSAKLADVECDGAYVKSLRNASGEIGNAVVFHLREDGHCEQVFVPGAPHLGHFAQYGELAVRVVVCVDVATAALIFAATQVPAVAAVHAGNVGPVCDALARQYPDLELIVAAEGLSSASPHAEAAFRATCEAAALRGLRLAVPGTSGSFAELHRADGHEAIAQQLDDATVPPMTSLELASADVAPSTQAQSGSSLLGDLVHAVRRTVVTSREAALAIALWIVFTHVCLRFALAPLLVATSPGPRCGKTSLLSLLIRLCHAPLAASNMSEAAIYRAIEQWAPTLIIDEADTFALSSKSLTGILNSGYKRATGCVVRTHKEGVVRLNTYGPKAMALIGELPEALMDRAVTVRLDRKRVDELVEPVAPAGPDDFSILRARLLRWVTDHGEAIASAEPPKLGLNNDRAEDNARPLLAIACAMGGPWVERARAALAELAKSSDAAPSHGEWLLADTARAFARHGSGRIMTAQLLDYLNAQEEAPWPTFSHGRAMTPRDLAGLFKRYGISSMQMRQGTEVVRGYQLEQFKQVFERYGCAAAKA